MSASQICESRRPRSMLQFLVPGTASPMVTAPVDPIAAGRWRGGPAAEMEPGAGREATGAPVAGVPELWLYLRRAADRWELVCKVFDSLAGWKCGSPPGPEGAPAYAGGGRGLQIVAGLSGGRWGHHLSRSRLGDWKVPGKAGWVSHPG